MALNLSNSQALVAALTKAAQDAAKVREAVSAQAALQRTEAAAAAGSLTQPVTPSGSGQRQP